VRLLPRGTVTFLFTDIEGSTGLLQDLGERYADELAEHRRRVRDAVARNNGIEVDTQGDAFFFAFPSANEALGAAREVQESLDAGPVHVRIGIHTGEPQLTDEGYVGLDVHKAARICATAHGGQVVFSRRTHELLEGSLPVQDLGLHRLKDLGRPEKLFQLGGRRFPPLRSLNATNLPAQSTPLVGRESELEEVQALVEESRLVTLTGTGGTGKTRLALQVAAELVDRFKDGVFWFPLAGLFEPELLLPTIAATLGAGGELAEHIDEKSMLLLLDNLEQIVDCAPALAGLLASCPNLKVLATSRAPLQLSSEREYDVQPLPAHDAVTLFCERAVQAEPLEAVEEICRRLDGLPLAIELAAARTRVLPPHDLLNRLERRLPLLTGGRRDAPERQRTLRAAIEWSFDLLSAEDQELFGRLSVFAGGWTLTAAEATVAADLDGLESLLEQSLLRRTAEGRFFFLETIREFALEGLAASGELDSVARRHAEWYAAQAEELQPRLWDAEHDATMASFDRDLANMLAALEWSRSDATLMLRLAAALGEYWLIRGYLGDGRRWLERALEANRDVHGAPRALALTGVSALAHVQGDEQRARAAAGEALSLARALGDTVVVVHALNRLANAIAAGRASPEARRFYEEAVELARTEGASRWLATSLLNLGIAQGREGMRAEAKKSMREALSVFDALSNRRGRAATLLYLARMATEEGDTETALLQLADGLRLYRELDRGPRIAECLEAVAAVADRHAEPERVVRLLAAADRLEAEAGARRRVGDPLLASARATLTEGAFADAWTAGAAMTLEEAVEYALEGS
jgi:predicted ATPase/class 3 adenylate cyclase